MADINKKEFLEARGWQAWYHDDYWVHPKICLPDRDYTYYGMRLDDAYEYEVRISAGDEFDKEDLSRL